MVSYSVLMAICLALQAISDCVLDRNEKNKYPFVIKLETKGTLMCHGALFTPRHVLSTYLPVQAYVGTEDMKELRFVGEVLGPGGTRKCDVSRSPDEGMKPSRDLNVALWRMVHDFPVTQNRPYLFTRLEDIDSNVMRRHFEDTIGEECCIVPALDSQSTGARIEARSVTFIKNMSDYWTRVYCDDDEGCVDAILFSHVQFFAYDPKEPSVVADYLQGAVIICDEHPVGILRSIIEDSDGHRVTVFEQISPLASTLRGYAESEWPPSAGHMRKAGDMRALNSAPSIMQALSTTCVFAICITI